METETTRDAAAYAWAAKHGITYGAEFVPFSKSRNAKPLRECKTSELSINWRVTFTKDGRAFSTDYQQGIGFLPKHLRYFGAPTNDVRADIIEAVEKGRASIRTGAYMSKPLTPPTAPDVLESLALDASVEDYRDYEEWAADFGYDPDSRAGEKVFQECRRLADGMRSVFGRAALAELRAIDWNA